MSVIIGGSFITLLVIALSLRSSTSYSEQVANPNKFTSKSMCGTNSRTLCTVGSRGPAGGAIFYVDSLNRYPNFDYLEIAPPGWNGGNSLVDPTFIWCSDISHRIITDIDNWANRQVGRGQSNTEFLLKECDSGIASALRAYNASGRSKYHDWFIPSVGEMDAVITNLQGESGLTPTEYWTSSEFSETGGWAESVGHGYQGSATKQTTFSVRPIRSF